MRMYDVQDMNIETLNWRTLHDSVMFAFEHDTTVGVKGEHESIGIEFELFVGRVVTKKLFDTQLPRFGVEFSGAALGTGLVRPSFYVCRYGDGDEALHLRIEDDPKLD